MSVFVCDGCLTTNYIVSNKLRHLLLCKYNTDYEDIHLLSYASLTIYTQEQQQHCFIKLNGDVYHFCQVSVFSIFKWLVGQTDILTPNLCHWLSQCWRSEC